MTNENVKPDPAAIFAMAESLYRNGEIRAGVRNADNSYTRLEATDIDLSDAYDGGDEFMRQCMRVATMFERWACAHMDWEVWDTVWPYEMEERFGPAVYDYQGNVTSLASFKIPDCRRLAVVMNLPLLPEGEPNAVGATSPEFTGPPMEDPPF